ncbi:hypothetical protein KAU19_03600 [Candidatus Parcubacteria bacterium]|nr:hypothetical protein [Candidatus Parcubacteria bacterium]
MSKKITIFIILISILILTSCSIIKPAADKENKTVGQDNNQQADKSIDMGLLTKAYQMEVKVILNNYLRQTQDESLITIDDVKQTKNSFLALKMPSKYKDLHLNLVLAMDKMEDYLFDGDEGKLRASQELIKQAKEEYEWLN